MWIFIFIPVDFFHLNKNTWHRLFVINHSDCNKTPFPKNICTLRRLLRFNDSKYDSSKSFFEAAGLSLSRHYHYHFHHHLVCTKFEIQILKKGFQINMYVCVWLVLCEPKNKYISSWLNFASFHLERSAAGGSVSTKAKQAQVFSP